jgi:hypothetical protein
MLVSDRLLLAVSFLQLELCSLLGRLLRPICHFRKSKTLRSDQWRRGTIFHPMRARTLALKVLARDGLAAIWVLHLSAARACREGRQSAAARMIEIADAAEREWLKQGGHASLGIGAGSPR